MGPTGKGVQNFRKFGDSEKMVEDFTEDFIKQFARHSSLSREEIIGVLSKKLQSGGSDRASKMMKFAKVLKEKLVPDYVHFKCDNHINETAWEEVQELRKVEMVEDLLKKCFGIIKNSASRKLMLAAIAEEFEEKTLKIVGLFSVKFLTSEKAAVKSFLVDYLQLILLMKNLINNKCIKKASKRVEIKRVLSTLLDARVLINAVALHSALEQGIARYQLWSQKMEASAFEREFEKNTLYSEMQVMKEVRTLPKDIRKFLRYIDYNTKTFKKMDGIVSYCPDSIQEAEA